MSLLHKVWQASWCACPLIVTRHSWQMPMPHKGARAIPVTEMRVLVMPQRAKAAATLMPGSTRCEVPLIVRVICAVITLSI
jgi:hypothetical protein